MSHADAPMLSGRPRPIRGFSKARRLFKKQFWSTSGEPFVDGDVHIACQLRETPLTNGVVGLEDKKLSATRSPGVFDWPRNSERVKILPWSHEFSKLYFSSG